MSIFPMVSWVNYILLVALNELSSTYLGNFLMSDLVEVHEGHDIGWS